MKKALFVATVMRTHMVAFHLPFLRLLRENGYEVHVCARNDYVDPTELSSINGTASGGGPLFWDRYYDLPFHRSPFNPGNFKVYSQLKALIDANDYSLIHCHTPVGGLLTRLAAHTARHKGTKVIYTAHGFHFFHGSPIKNWLLYFPVEWLLAHLTDTLVTINEEDYTQAQRLPAHSVVYVPGVGIDLTRFRPHPAAEKILLRQRLGFPASTFILIYAGEMTRRKHQDLVIRAVHSLKDMIPDLLVLLPGSGALEMDYRRLATSLGLAETVVFPGFCQNIHDLMAAADVALSASRHEGLPVNVMEAMATGLPLVVTDCRGNRDLVSDHENGFIVSQDDVNALVAAINQLYLSAELRKKFGDCSLVKIKAYSIQAIIARMKEIYDLKDEEQAKQ